MKYMHGQLNLFNEVNYKYIRLLLIYFHLLFVYKNPSNAVKFKINI